MRVACARLGKALELAKLMNSQSRLDVAEVVFESRLVHFVIPAAVLTVAVPGILADAVQSEHLDALGEGCVIDGHHAAFAGGEILGRIKTEADRVTGKLGGA